MKGKNINFRTSDLVRREAHEIPFSYEEIFMVGLKVLRDGDSLVCVRIGELEEELSCLREELGKMEVLKEKIKSKESMLKDLYSELEVKKESYVDVIEYNRNKNLGVVNGLVDRFKDYPFDVDVLMDLVYIIIAILIGVVILKIFMWLLHVIVVLLIAFFIYIYIDERRN